MTKTLIVYHSRSGRTRRVAQALARRLQADIEEITPAAPREGLLGYVQCALESFLQCAPATRETVHDPMLYDLVLLGTPVWVWSMSSPVRGWVRRHRLGGAKLAFFCTMGGAGAEQAFAQMQALCGKTPVATLALTEAQVDKKRSAAAVDRFVADLKHRAPRRRASKPRPPQRATAAVARGAR